MVKWSREQRKSPGRKGKIKREQIEVKREQWKLLKRSERQKTELSREREVKRLREQGGYTPHPLNRATFSIFSSVRNN